jgi:hypothetical protein
MFYFFLMLSRNYLINYWCGRVVERTKDRKFLRLAIGARSQQCRVKEGFKVVVVVEKTQAYNELDLPLLNRFEKQVMCHDDMLEHDAQRRLKKQLVQWMHQVKDECGEATFEDVFLGHFPNSAASLVMSRVTKNSTNEPKLLLQMKAELADAAHPLCVLKSKLLRKDGGELWQATVRTDELVGKDGGELWQATVKADTKTGYFERHESLSAIIRSLQREREGVDSPEKRERLQAVVVTSSPSNHLPGNGKKLGMRLGYDQEPDLVKLAEFSSSHEQQVRLEEVIVKRGREAGSPTHRLLVVQCDPSETCHRACINHAKYLCEELIHQQAIEAQKAGREATVIDIVFVVHTPPRAKKVMNSETIDTTSNEVKKMQLKKQMKEEMADAARISEKLSYWLDYERGWHHVFIDDIREVGGQSAAPRKLTRMRSMTRKRSSGLYNTMSGVVTAEYRQWHQFVKLDKDRKFLLGADKEGMVGLLNLSDPAHLAFMDRRLLIVCSFIKSPAKKGVPRTDLQDAVTGLLESPCKEEFLEGLAKATEKVIREAGKRQVIERDGASKLAYSGSSREYVMSTLYALVELALAKVIAWSHRNFGLSCLKNDPSKVVVWAAMMRNRSIFGKTEAFGLMRSFPNDVNGMRKLAATTHECENDRTYDVTGGIEGEPLSSKVPLTSALLRSFHKRKANSGRTLVDRLQHLMSKSLSNLFSEQELDMLHEVDHEDQYHDILHLEILKAGVGELANQGPYADILRKVVYERLGYKHLCRGERAVSITGGEHKSRRGTLKMPLLKVSGIVGIDRGAEYEILLDGEDFVPTAQAVVKVKGKYFDMGFQRTDFFTEALVGWWAHEYQIGFLFDILEESPRVRDSPATKKSITEAEDLSGLMGTVVLHVLESWIEEAKDILHGAKGDVSLTAKWITKTNIHRAQVERLIESLVIWESSGLEVPPDKPQSKSDFSRLKPTPKQNKSFSYTELCSKYILLGVMKILVEELGHQVKIKKSECEVLLLNQPYTFVFFTKLKDLLKAALPAPAQTPQGDNTDTTRRPSRCLRRLLLEVVLSTSVVRMACQKDAHLNTLRKLSIGLYESAADFNEGEAKNNITRGRLLPEWPVILELCELVLGTSTIDKAICSAELRKALLQVMLAPTEADPQRLLAKFTKKKLSEFAKNALEQFAKKSNQSPWTNLAPVVSVIVERGEFWEIGRSAIRLIRTGVVEVEPRQTTEQVRVRFDDGANSDDVPVASLIRSAEGRQRGKLKAGEQVKVNMFRKHMEDASRDGTEFL